MIEIRSLDFTIEVLGYFAHADARDQLFWWTNRDGANVRFYANCSDFFYWGTADAEEITPENLHLLKEAYDELNAISRIVASMELGNVFSGKARKLRPQTPCYYKPDAENAAEMNALYDSFGPERTRESMG